MVMSLEMVSVLASMRDCAWSTSTPNLALKATGSTLDRRSEKRAEGSYLKTYLKFVLRRYFLAKFYYFAVYRVRSAHNADYLYPVHACSVFRACKRGSHQGRKKGGSWEGPGLVGFIYILSFPFYSTFNLTKHPPFTHLQPIPSEVHNFHHLPNFMS